MSALVLGPARRRAPRPAGTLAPLLAGMAFAAALLLLGSALHLTCAVFCLHEALGGAAMPTGARGDEPAAAPFLPGTICSSAR